MKKVFAILVATSIMVAASFAAPQGKMAGQGQSADAQVGAAIDKMDKDAGLGLSAKQKTQVSALAKSMQQKSMAMLKKMQGGGKMDMTAMKKEGETMKAEFYGGMKKILTAAQYKKFEAYSAKQEASMKARMSKAGDKQP